MGCDCVSVGCVLCGFVAVKAMHLRSSAGVLLDVQPLAFTREDGRVTQMEPL